MKEYEVGKIREYYFVKGADKYSGRHYSLRGLKSRIEFEHINNEVKFISDGSLNKFEKSGLCEIIKTALLKRQRKNK